MPLHLEQTDISPAFIISRTLVFAFHAVLFFRRIFFSTAYALLRRGWRGAWRRCVATAFGYGVLPLLQPSPAFTATPVALPAVYADVVCHCLYRVLVYCASVKHGSWRGRLPVITVFVAYARRC
jgi:hypothetical protein